MSIWHDDRVFPEDKRYWLAFINVRSNGNKFWKVSPHLADFIEDVSGARLKVCDTKIEKWCYLDDLFAQQAEINRLREALSFYAMQKTTIKSIYNGKPCRMIYCCADVAEQALNDESEINE